MPVAPSYADPDQRAAFARWLEQKRKDARVSKTALGGALNHDTTQQVNKFLRGRALPMPDTLRKIAGALGVSWVEAFANAGYYRDILCALADLKWLSHRWLLEDKALDSSDPSTFRQFGVLRLNGRPIREVVSEARYADRYFEMFWEEQPRDEPPEITHPGNIEPKVAARIEANLRAKAPQPERVCCIIPKPLATAILIAVAGFPRRGDIYKDSAVPYAANLLASADPLIDLASGESRRRSLPPLLGRADEVLKDRFLPLETKRIIAAEYMVAWADFECQLFTHMGRLAALAFFGVAGCSESHQTPEVFLPQYRVAALPDPKALSIQHKVA